MGELMRTLIGRVEGKLLAERVWMQLGGAGDGIRTAGSSATGRAHP